VLVYQLDNVAATQTNQFLLLNNQQAFAGLPWARPSGPVASALRPPLPERVNVQVRLLGQASLACAQASTISSSDGGKLKQWMPSPPWNLSTAVLPDLDLALLVFSCTACEPPLTRLSFFLNFTCQSFHLEALFVDSNGDMVVIAPAEDAVAGNSTPTSNATLLTTVTWPISYALSSVDDQVSGSQSARGYRMSSNPLSLGPYLDPTTFNSGGGVMPLANQVGVTITFTQETMFFTTTLVNKTSPTQLLASIIGLMGTLSVFAAGFAFFKRTKKNPIIQRLIGSKPLPESGGIGGGASTGGGTSTSTGDAQQGGGGKSPVHPSGAMVVTHNPLVSHPSSSSMPFLNHPHHQQQHPQQYQQQQYFQQQQDPPPPAPRAVLELSFSPGAPAFAAHVARENDLRAKRAAELYSAQSSRGGAFRQSIHSFN
jgi:hypothetical protein